MIRSPLPDEVIIEPNLPVIQGGKHAVPVRRREEKHGVKDLVLTVSHVEEVGFGQGLLAGSNNDRVFGDVFQQSRAAGKRWAGQEDEGNITRPAPVIAGNVHFKLQLVDGFSRGVRAPAIQFRGFHQIAGGTGNESLSREVNVGIASPEVLPDLGNIVNPDGSTGKGGSRLAEVLVHRIQVGRHENLERFPKGLDTYFRQDGGSHASADFHQDMGNVPRRGNVERIGFQPREIRDVLGNEDGDVNIPVLL